MKRFLILSCFATTLGFALPPLAAPGLSGTYKLSYLKSDLEVAYWKDKEKETKVKEFDFKKVGTPPIPSPLYLFHNPKDPSATLIGAGSETPRYCEGENDMLSQHLDCTPLSRNIFTDEKTQCEIRSIFLEAVMFDIVENLRYGRMEMFIFDKDTAKECLEYKTNLMTQLEDGTAPDFFKAMKAAGLIKELKDFPDGFYLTHYYQLTETDEKVAELPRGSETGAYDLEYKGKSKTVSFNGKDRNDLVESDFYDSNSESFPVERLDTILFFYDAKKDQAKISGGGQSKLRTCEKTSKPDDENEVFSCSLFKAMEEELGTGCTIEHWLKEEITLVPGEVPRYQRVEQRSFLPETKEGCESYRKKIAQELSEGSAELFFRVLQKTGGIKDLDKLGDTFQIIHQYQLTPAN